MKAHEYARRISVAMNVLPAGVALEARVADGEIEIVLTLSNEHGIQGIKEQRIAGLAPAAASTSPERFDAFLAATARWLGAQSAARRAEIFPHDVFVLAMLADARLVTAQDFSSVLHDPARREAYVARPELAEFFARHALSPPNDDALRALYTLTPEGRASKGLPESVRTTRWLASWPWGQAALVAMMADWADEPYDPYDVAWGGGPGATNLLLYGAWRTLDPVLRDHELRRRAITAVDRVALRVADRDLARAGFG